MADKFFDEEKPQEEVEEPQKIKLGDAEYTQEELEHLVGLGKIGEEAEQKFKTKIDKVWPDYTRKSQQVKEYEAELTELREKVKSQVQSQPTTPVLTEDLKRQALEQAEALGIGPKAMEGVIRQTIRDEIAARDLISDVNGVISEAKGNGQPEATVDQILQHMQETGIKNPKTAYKDLFEEELDAWKEKQLSTLKPSGMVTNEKSVAGGKYPTQPKPPKNREELLKALTDAMTNPEA